MRNYRNTNDKTIENAFARLSGSYGKSVQEGLRRMLDMGMESTASTSRTATATAGPCGMTALSSRRG